jgi:hypothetical protein
MEWILILAGGGAVYTVWRIRTRRQGQRARSQQRAIELAHVQRLADEDITVFGEELSRLDREVGDRALDEAGRVDYQRALDAYESAQHAVPAMTSAGEVSRVTDTLAIGRYALACVRARVAGQPVPERRAPCFYNPQHGPSVRDVMWTQPGSGTRLVPACAQDAARVAAHEKPDVRYVEFGRRRVPYWEAGDALAPHGKGYFVGDWAGAVVPAVGAFDQPAATSPYSPPEPGGPGWQFDPGSDGIGGDSSGGQG